jgi:histidyl-tRNA synthetase
VLFDQTKAAIEDTFQLFGFWPLDTPVIEKEEILTAKGGGETAKQIYRIDPSEHSQAQALRFDLTVPLARYVAMHESELAFPFRRYQISKVYRGERNQKGRYREFYQADVDVIGREDLSLLTDAEIPAIVNKVFLRICKADAVFHINHRGLLNAFFASIGVENFEESLRAIDKLDKIGEGAVRDLLAEKAGLSKDQQDQVFALLQIQGDNEHILQALHAMAQGGQMNQDFQTYLEELETVYRHMLAFEIQPDHVVIDLHITRGLDYYTGMVYETFLKGYEGIGSVCSGGRYDNLAENFTSTHMPGVGISLGLTRLFYQLNEAGLLKVDDAPYLTALIVPMGDAGMDFAIETVNALRRRGLVSQVYFDPGKMKKKFAYADKLGAQYVIIIGDDEIAEKKLSLKDMATGEQESLPLEEALDRIQAGVDSDPGSHKE